jgi:hypothetical protein
VEIARAERRRHWRRGEHDEHPGTRGSNHEEGGSRAEVARATPLTLDDVIRRASAFLKKTLKDRAATEVQSTWRVHTQMSNDSRRRDINVLPQPVDAPDTRRRRSTHDVKLLCGSCTNVGCTVRRDNDAASGGSAPRFS